MPKYEIIIWWESEEERYIAEVPELPGCMADGKTLREVTDAIEEAMQLWIEVNQERGFDIPQPKGRLTYA